MTDRVEQTYALLRSYADWEPSITTWTGSLVRSSGAQGETAGRREECPHCGGTGRAGRGSCRFCKGSGSQWVDPQTGRAVTAPADGHTFTVRDYEQGVYRRRVRCDRCGGTGCPHCASTGTVEVIDTRPADRSLRRLEQQWPQLRAPGDPDQAPGWWLSAALDRKQAQWARGSYPELERLLRALDVAHPVRFRLLDRHLIHPSDGVIATGRMLVTVDEIVVDLAERMPRPVRVPEEATRWGELGQASMWRGRLHRHRQLREQRDTQIRAAVVGGTSVSQAASTFGLSARRVRQIVNGSTALGQATGPAA